MTTLSNFRNFAKENNKEGVKIFMNFSNDSSRALIDFQQTVNYLANTNFDDKTKMCLLKESMAIGLPVDERKFAYIVKYENKHVIVPSWQGLRALAYREGYFDDVKTFAIHKEDKLPEYVNIDLSTGTYTVSGNFGIAINKSREKYDDYIGGLAVIYKSNICIHIEYIPKCTLDIIKGKSKMKGNGEKIPIWLEYPSEMIRKTVLKRALKHLSNRPNNNPFLQKAIDADNQIYHATEEFIDVIPEEKSNNTIIDEIEEERKIQELEDLIDLNVQKNEENNINLPDNLL